MDFFETYMEVLARMQIPLSEEYISSSLTTAIIVGVIACALIIFTAVMSKKSLGLGIVAGIFAIIGSIGNHLAVVYFHTTEFFKVIFATGSNTSDAYDNLMDSLSQYYAEQLPKMGLYVLGNMLVMAAWILSLIFIIKMLKVKPKVFGIFALILHIIRYIAVAPMDAITPILGTVPVTEAIQKSQDLKVYAMTLLPLVLVAIVSLIYRIKSSKAPVAAPAAPAEPVEAPAEAPAQDQE